MGKTSDVVKGRYLRVSIGLWVASFMGLLLVYGLNTWLPKIMGEAGYSIKAGTGLLLALNVGAVIGLLIAGGISDSRGNKPTVLLWFGLAAAFLALLSIKMDNTLVVYAAVLLAGIFVFSAQVLVYAFVGHLYPTEIRGTALGMAAGVGRVGAIVGPFLGGATGHRRHRLPLGLLRLRPGRPPRRPSPRPPSRPTCASRSPSQPDPWWLLRRRILRCRLSRRVEAVDDASDCGPVRNDANQQRPPSWRGSSVEWKMASWLGMSRALAPR